MHKNCTLLAFVFLLITPLFCTKASSGGVVINEFQIAGKTSYDEFVELKNTSDHSIDVTGWQLGKHSSTGSKSNLLTTFPSKILDSEETIIIAHADFVGSPDLFYSSKSYALSDNSAIVLYGAKVADGSRGIMDTVGYGDSKIFEGLPITNPKTSEIYSRKGGEDTGDNKKDFYLSYSPPKEEIPKDEDEADDRSETEEKFPEATVGANIEVSEFMINPEGSDTEGEWIEIFNAGKDANISGYSIADRMGSPKKYTFPSGTIIKQKQYLAFYSGKTPISLNNDSDAVEVRSPEGSVISYSSESGKGIEGMSFAKNGKAWSWTKVPTPGRANVIDKPTTAELSNTKKDEKNGEVLALVDEAQLPGEDATEETIAVRKNDQLLGYGLILLAILGGISYTLYINKEWLREFYYNKIRKRDHLTGREIWTKIKGWRSISINGRSRGR